MCLGLDSWQLCDIITAKIECHWIQMLREDNPHMKFIVYVVNRNH